MLFSIASLNKIISRMIYMEVSGRQLKICKKKTNLFYCQLRSGDLQSLWLQMQQDKMFCRLCSWFSEELHSFIAVSCSAFENTSHHFFFFSLDGTKCNLHIQDLNVLFFFLTFFFFMNTALIVRSWNPIISLKHSQVMNCPSHSKSRLDRTVCLFLLTVHSQNIVTVFFELD